MKKALLFCFVLVASVLTVKAQSDDELLPRFSAGFGIGGTVGPNSGGFPVGGSVGVKGEYPIAGSPVCITGSVAYQFFASKDGFSTGYNSYEGNYTSGALASFVPVMVGARVYSGKLFFEGDAGASFNLNSTHANYTGSNVALALSPSIGYGFRFGSSQKIGLDLSLSYETRLESNKAFADDNIQYSSYLTHYGSYNLIAFHVAFSLGL
jgi:hypothetical protein